MRLEGPLGFVVGNGLVVVGNGLVCPRAHGTAGTMLEKKVEFFLQNTHWKHKENGKIRAQVFDVADFTFDVAEYGWISHIF